MKQSTICFFLLTTLVTLVSTVAGAQTDEDQVKAVIESAYVQGIHNGGPVADIRAGFHPSFIMFVSASNNIKQMPLEEWITNIEKNRATSSNDGSKATAKFISVSVVGTSANAQLELYRKEKKVFTDNLLLYKFPEDWKIVSKTFYRHP
ncbi:MAG TPA: nuclear transport factor 2 family protein [Cyclobacteriaceae bacterium]|nr:nuclear transport factor 2 family protein [Cyclobacteriaceae bacterium]